MNKLGTVTRRSACYWGWGGD